jgi:hypothetical protein
VFHNDLQCDNGIRFGVQSAEGTVFNQSTHLLSGADGAPGVILAASKRVLTSVGVSASPFAKSSEQRELLDPASVAFISSPPNCSFVASSSAIYANVSNGSFPPLSHDPSRLRRTRVLFERDGPAVGPFLDCPSLTMFDWW